MQPMQPIPAILPIPTIPDGAWEAGQTNESLQDCHRTKGSPEKNYPPDENESVEPLPESERPRKDGPGGA